MMNMNTQFHMPQLELYKKILAQVVLEPWLGGEKPDTLVILVEVTLAIPRHLNKL